MWAPPPSFLHCSQGHEAPEPGSSFCLQESTDPGTKHALETYSWAWMASLFLAFLEVRQVLQGGKWAVVKRKQLPRELTRTHPLGNLKYMASLLVFFFLTKCLLYLS